VGCLIAVIVIGPIGPAIVRKVQHLVRRGRGISSSSSGGSYARSSSKAETLDDSDHEISLQELEAVGEADLVTPAPSNA
jgi:ATP-dependent protease HslVU (ClpYQ) peptidase subunit